MKILFSGDSPTVNTGFGVVSKNILGRLKAMGHDITVLGINHYGEPYDQKQFPYPIYPCDKGGEEQVFGFHKLWYIESQVKPDLVFFLNDPWLVQKYIDARGPQKNPYTKTIAYFPTDGGPLKPQWAKALSELDAQICYSNFAERIVADANDGKAPANLHQIYHGVDRSVFFPMNQSEARFRLNLPQDAFIVGMVARNQPRKRFDILMKAFSEFAKDKPKAKLYLHTSPRDIGFDIADISRQLNLRDKLIMTEGVTPAHGVDEDVLNVIYNTFDVNCLISMGDGFGLPVAESMATGCVQLVSGHSCLKELVEGHGGLTVKTASWIMNSAGINTWGGVSDVDDIISKLNILYANRELRIAQADQGYRFISQEKFTWDYAADKFNRLIKDLFYVL